MDTGGAEALWEARRTLGVGMLPQVLELPDTPLRSFLLGWVAAVDGRNDDAIPHLDDAQRRFGRDDHWRARALRMLGDALGEMGDDLSAEQNYVEAMRLFDLYDDTYSKVSTLQNSASLGYHSPATAVARLEEALEMAAPLGDNELTALILTNLGEMGSADGRHEQARQWIDQALALHADMSPNLRAQAVASLAKIEFDQGRIDAAARLLDTVPAEHDVYYALTRIRLARERGRLACLQHRPADAVRILQAQLRPPMHPLQELPLQEGLSEAYEAAGDLAAALAAARRVGAINAELQESSATRRAAALDAWHRNEELRSRNEVAEMQIDTLEQALEELTRAHDAVNRMIHTDALTGIDNRYHLVAEAPEVLERASADSPAQIALIDIDAFKQVNDTHGHAAGDRVLIAVATLLSRHSHAGDIVSRHGGDEFVVLRPTDDPAPLVDDMDAVRRALAAAPLRIVHDDAEATIPVGVSIGVAHITGPGLDGALFEADRAMYAAKRAGRNRVVEDPDATPTTPQR